MKIDQVDQTGALNQSTAVKPAKPAPVSAFSDILNREIQSPCAPTGAEKTVAPPPGAGIAGIGNVLMAESATAIAAPNQAELDVMDNMETLLNQWENYAGALSSPTSGSGLKQAYGMLENIETGVRKLKEGSPQLGTDSPLNSLVNELEVMTVTEKMKFNRGDYNV